MVRSKAQGERDRCYKPSWEVTDKKPRVCFTRLTEPDWLGEVTTTLGSRDAMNPKARKRHWENEGRQIRDRQRNIMALPVNQADRKHKRIWTTIAEFLTGWAITQDNIQTPDVPVPFWLPCLSTPYVLGRMSILRSSQGESFPGSSDGGASAPCPIQLYETYLAAGLGEEESGGQRVSSCRRRYFLCQYSAKEGVVGLQLYHCQ